MKGRKEEDWGGRRGGWERRRRGGGVGRGGEGCVVVFVEERGRRRRRKKGLRVCACVKEEGRREMSVFMCAEEGERGVCLLCLCGGEGGEWGSCVIVVYMKEGQGDVCAGRLRERA